jgi:mRNA deadenylase 3'-5' endonuclease subunit Ccr4
MSAPATSATVRKLERKLAGLELELRLRRQAEVEELRRTLSTLEAKLSSLKGAGGENGNTPRGPPRVFVKVEPAPRQHVHIALRDDDLDVRIKCGRDELLDSALKRLEAATVRGGGARGFSLHEADWTLIVSSELTCANAWRGGQLLVLLGRTFAVTMAKPSCSIVLPFDGRSPPVVGCLLAPAVRQQSCERIEWAWWRCCRASAASGVGDESTLRVLVGRCSSYTPSQLDVEAYLEVEGTPCDGDCAGETTCLRYRLCVEQQPLLPGSVALRSAWLPREPAADAPAGTLAVRIVSYNLLADKYVHPRSYDDCRYSYVPAHAIVAMRRFPRALRELIAHDTDVLCLQEVETSVFQRLLLPTLRALGYSGTLALKARSSEGCAIFWRDDMFELRESRVWLLGPPPATQASPLGNLLARRSNLHALLGQLGTVAQAVVLRTRCAAAGGRTLVVANTHLYYHPQADHVRLIQAHGLLGKVDALCKRTAKAEGIAPAHVIAGDFNSLVPSAVVQLLLRGEVEPSHACWRNLEFQFEVHRSAPQGRKRAQTGGAAARITAALLDGHVGADAAASSAAGPCVLRAPEGVARHFSAAGFPEFTTCVPDFVGTIDYVFASEADFDFEPPDERTAAPMPLAVDMEAAGPHMPSAQYPSDHLSIACDLRLRLL